MEFSVYLIRFAEMIKQRQPITHKRTVEDYLAAFAALPPVLRERSKSADVSEVTRNEGNALFSNGNYQEAAIIYTESIKLAPAYSLCSALGYANRSAALYRLKAYKDCILDIDRALNLPYPDNLRVKLVSRKEAAVSELTRAKNQANNDEPIDDLNFAHGENAKLPDASRGVDIVGGKLVANMAFRTGDVLVVEKPYFTIAEIEQSPTYCKHCLKKTFCLIPCDMCTSEVYCSKKCRTEAYQNYHRVECRIQYTLISSASTEKQSLVSLLRCLNIMTEQGDKSDEMFADFQEIEQSSNPIEHGFTEDQFVGNSRRAFLSSLSWKNTSPDPDSYFDVTYLVILLKNHTDFFKTNGDVPSLAKLLLKLKTVSESNHFQIVRTGTWYNKACGTYPLTSLTSHGCYNNTVMYRDNEGRIISRASENIKPGDQISSNYLPPHIPFLRRRNSQLGVFIATDEEWRCQKCKRVVRFPLRLIPIKISDNLRAKLLRKPYDIESLWKLLNIVHENYEPQTLAVEFTKWMIVAAYEGRGNPAEANNTFRFLGII